jgi:site-specific DNA-methyltransferase (adenine-specific)
VAGPDRQEAAKRPARNGTSTSAFGAGKRESHDASAFYDRFPAPEISDDDQLGAVPDLEFPVVLQGDARMMTQLPDASVALVVTSPPYFVGKEYELAVAGQSEEGTAGVPDSYIEYLALLREVFAECCRVLEPGGRIAVNVANLGRKPYRSLAADVIRILQDDLHLLLRGEVIWQKGEGATGSVAWGSFRRAANPVLRDLTERVIIASKGRFDRAVPAGRRKKDGRPNESTVSSDEFMEATLDLWRIDAESARRVNHPAPFPVELPRRLIDLYTYADDVVLDPFAGSGSTVVAAQQLGRRGVGYDLDPDYVAQANERLAEQPDLDEVADRYRVHAASQGKKAHDLALDVLEQAGFTVAETGSKVGGTSFPFLVTDTTDTHRYYVDIAGTFTTVRPGMLRTDTVWKTLGKAHVLAATHPRSRLLVLTSHLPKKGSEGRKALRAVGPAGVFDAIEMFDPEGVERLTRYAKEAADGPGIGFWTQADLESGSPAPPAG